MLRAPGSPPRVFQRGGVVAIVIAGCLLLGRGAAAQNVDYSLDATVTFYGDNTEFFNPFRDGETTIGAHVFLVGEARTSDRLAIRAGVFGNQRFGSRDAFEEVRPVFTLAVGNARSQLLLGTIQTGRRAQGIGPDRSGPHSLLPPLQLETLAFTRPWEAGVQWLFDTADVKHESWVHWQRIANAHQRERIDAGAISRFKVHRAITIGGDFFIVHEGGQLTSNGRVGDSIAGSMGGEVGGAAGALDKLSLEAFIIGSRFDPNRADDSQTRAGLATFLRVSAEKDHWRAHAILFRGDDFLAVEGDANYLSVRMDGTYYRNLRDYGEVGFTRAFSLAPESWLEASLRGHRVEHHYDYSFRILAVAKLRID
ncbi:MAG TPA: hypothetical protein VJ691_18905 [Vicinamibacterales bacterium]|nr:hypothetical protein [Vicinamibacterales bacterium]